MRISWSKPLPVAPLGLSLAREAGTVLIRDEEHFLALHDRQGKCVMRQRAPASLLGATISDDGRVIGLIGKRAAWMLRPDWTQLWKVDLPERPAGLAIDHLGARLAVADEKGGLRVYDGAGKLLWTATTVRPLVHLAFVPEAPALVGAAEFGLFGAFDAKGKALWRDGLVAHTGSMAVTGNGSRILLACFTEGVIASALTQSRQATLPGTAPSRLAAISYQGDILITTGMEGELTRREINGEVRSQLTLPSRIIALGMEALGKAAYAALADATLVRLERRT